MLVRLAQAAIDAQGLPAGKVLGLGAVPTPPPSRIRFFWDFHGPEAEATARHFATHLAEFFARNELALAARVEVLGAGRVSVFSDMPDVPAIVLQQMGHEAADDATPTVAARVGEALRPQRIEPLIPSA